MLTVNTSACEIPAQIKGVARWAQEVVSAEEDERYFKSHTADSLCFNILLFLYDIQTISQEEMRWSLWLTDVWWGSASE